MEPYNRTAKRRADEAKMDEKAKKKNVRPKARPVDVSPNAEAADQEHVKKFRDGGSVRGCKPGQMTGKKFSGTY